ncbi:MAG TPA: hypothetical protein VIX20_18940 [Ktedonobacteraceae bacterium]
MNSSSTSTKVSLSQKRQSEANTSLYGRWLLLARIVWIVIVVLSLTISLVDIPLQFAQFHIVCVGSSCTGQQLNASIVQELHKMNLSVDFYAVCFVILNFGFYFIWFVVAVVIFWRKSDDWMALLVALFLVLFPATQSLGSPGDVGAAYPSVHILTSFLDDFGWISFLLFLYLFPDGRFAPRWTALLIFVMLLSLVFSILFFNSYLNLIRVLPILDFAPTIIGIGVGIFSQIYRNIRVSNGVQRQQTKWIVFGVTAAVGIFIALVVISSLRSPSNNNYNFWGEVIGNIIFNGAVLLIPISIGFSILRYRLYDIDLLINRTLVYGTLTVLLALIYFGCVFALQNLVRGITGQVGQSQLIIVGSTLAIAALFQPLRGRIQRIIDRRFYRQKYDAARTLATFSATLRNEVDLNQLREHLITVVQETMQPTHVSLWLRPSEPQRTATGVDDDATT